MKAAVQVAVRESLACAPAWVKRLGTCTAYAPASGVAHVLFDGDTAAVPCLVQTVRPNPRDRVVVEIVPGDVGSVAWVVGRVGGTDAPAGAVVWITAGDTALPPPAGYIWGTGQYLDISAFPGLYAVYEAEGLPHGANVGTTFKVPDLTGSGWSIGGVPVVGAIKT